MLADAVLSALKGFATEVATWTNQGSLLSVTGHIAQIENAVAQDVHAGETAAKAVLGELYSAFHGHTAEPAAPAPETPLATGGLVTQAPTVLPSETGAETVVQAPVAADPTVAAPAPQATDTPAPSSTDSAPSITESSTPSASTATDSPAV